MKIHTPKPGDLIRPVAPTGRFATEPPIRLDRIDPHGILVMDIDGPLGPQCAHVLALYPSHGRDRVEHGVMWHMASDTFRSTDSTDADGMKAEAIDSREYAARYIDRAVI